MAQQPSSSSDIIQPISRDTVHKICSGQVVLNLTNAVKELVENAIDAGATIIHIHLINYGADLIEVSDNGMGVLKENFQNLTLKHYTSKIRQFSDLEHINTLGFRGEALSSLCALSELSILTKHKTAEHATKIQFDSNGKIIKEILGAREQGTTVSLQNIFSTLPVRRKEFTKNLKREFNKMCQFLYAYCLVSKGIKFSCTNTTGNNNKNKIVATDGLNTVKENIINVFGAKQISSLVDIELVRPTPEILEEYNVKSKLDDELPYSFEFLISSAAHGNGRSTNDRQFFYINSRPCVPTKIIKLINETYKQYNSNQYPFVYLNIISKSCLIDVNVTPDKRQIFMEKENLLLAIIKASLLETMKSFPSSYQVQNTSLSQSIVSFLNTSREEPKKSLKRSATDCNISKGSILERFQKRSKSENNTTFIKNFTQTPLEKTIEKDGSDENLNNFVKIASEIVEETIIECTGKIETPKIQNKSIEHVKYEKTVDNIEIENTNKNNKTNELDVKVGTIFTNETFENTNKTIDENKTIDLNKTIERETEIYEEIKIEEERTVSQSQKSVTMDVSIDKIKELLAKRHNKSKSEDNVVVRFRAEINPDNSKAAEAELEKQFSKEDFKNMTVIGQFNLGFLIAKLNNDLFIVDQHASDEKYNFEKLQENCVLEKQVLVNPKPLELTAGNESILIDNIEIFNKNGFNFNIDHSAPCTKRVSLTSIPISKSFVCGKDDIDEMLLMLQHSNKMCRPTRIRSMLASRACRKSVMVGKALSKSDMKRLLEHMAEIEHPWNCPHGRPTMRHLINLDLIVNSVQ